MRPVCDSGVCEQAKGPPAHHQIAHSGSAKGAVDDFITSACPETCPFGLARSFKPSPSRRSTAHSATDDQDHKLRDRFASLSASSPARRALLEKSSLAAWRALNLDLALRRACSSGERRCKPWSRRPNLGVLHVSVRWSNCHFKGRSGPPDNFCDNLIFLQWVICSASLGSGTRPSCFWL